MLLAIDAGNTNIVFAVYDGFKKLAQWRCKTDAARTADEYAVFLLQLFELNKIPFHNVKKAIISSVVPDANFALRELCKNSFACVPYFVGRDIADIGVTVRTDHPKEVGADRLVNAVAVLAYYKKTPAIVVDFGTATTFDVVDEDGAFIGGVIAPGVNLSLNALHAAAAKLPKISIRKPEKAIGRNTVCAMEAGMYWGYIGLVKCMLEKISAELAVKPYVIATGGLGALFAKDISEIDIVDDELTLRGLVSIYHYWEQKGLLNHG